MANSVKLEILTPHAMVYTGEIESLITQTVSGDEGFLPGHVWCLKLLREDGKVQFREAGSSEFKTVKVNGGYVEIRDTFTVYSEDVSDETEDDRNATA